jgi:hypothetical protein
MSMTTHSAELPPAVRRILDAVRRRIRAYVWVEGLALLIGLLGAAFWIGLAADWTFEPSPRLRQFALVALGLAACYVVYRYLLRRVVAPISDATAATILERRFPTLNEHVLTAVDVASSHECSRLYHPELVYATHQSAAHAVASVRAGELFHRGPLLRAVGSAAALAISIGLFALFSRDAFAFWLERITLSNEPWPRRVHLEVMGFPADARGGRVHKLAQDDDFELLVRAQAGDFDVPDEVEIRFRLADGRRGRDSMIRVGDTQAGAGRRPGAFQLFRYQFKRVAADMTFDVVGGDDRVRDLRLQVVDRPELFAIELECNYPEYLQREPRRLPVTGGMRIPEGARLVLHAGATKPLTAVRIHRANDQHDVQLQFAHLPQDSLRWEYGTFTDDDVLLVNVTDEDGVTSREPYRVSLAVVRDELPQVAVRLAGIAAAITPDAVLPLVGRITDDYGLDAAWFEYQVDDAPLATRPLAAQPAGASALETLEQFDLRAIDDSTGKRVLELKPGQHFALELKASDRFDLSDKPRAGSSQRFVLEVVTASDLLMLLERRELELRQRYEAIYEKMSDTRDLLGRIDFDEAGPGASGRRTPPDPAAAPQDPSEPASGQRARARRRLRASGSLQNVVQSTDEIAGIADAFDDLGDQLTNNRIDNPDLKSRLREQIARPLHRIADQRMPRLAAQLKLVERHLEDPPAAAPALNDALALADEILVEMRQVLDRMLELETYNEVVALLRGIITDQSEINRRTKERQKERLRELFQE